MISHWIWPMKFFTYPASDRYHGDKVYVNGLSIQMHCHRQVLEAQMALNDMINYFS